MSEASGDNTVQKSFMSKSLKFDFSDSKTLHDRVLLVGAKKFYVQSGYLVVWSEYFSGLFGPNFKEANDEEIEIKDVTSEDFNNFLMVAYPTKFSITEQNYPGLINLAHRFLAPRVIELCQEFFMDNFTDFNIITLLTLAFENDMVELKDMLANFIFALEVKTDVCRCKVCNFPYQKMPYCKHNNGGSRIEIKAWIHDNIDRISELSDEIQVFILRSSVGKF